MEKSQIPGILLSEEFLLYEYVELKKSSIEISKQYKIKSSTSVFYYLKKYGIPRRETQIARARIFANIKRWKGYEDIGHSFIKIAQHGAKNRGYEFNISIEYVWSLYINQNKRCALSGVLIEFAKKQTSEGRLLQTVSLDRIDSNKGYIEGNVQLVHKDINRMKMNMSDEDFIEWCTKVSRYSSKC